MGNVRIEKIGIDWIIAQIATQGPQSTLRLHRAPDAMLRPWIYRALTMLAHHYAMKNRGEMGALIEGLNKDGCLLAAFLEAAHRIDWRALNRRQTMAINMEACQTSTPASPQVAPLKSFAFRRTNLVRSSE